MEQQIQDNKFESRKYWISLPAFYADKSTLSLSVIDSDCKVMLRIASVLPGMEGRPQAGQQKYDHKGAANFALNIFEIQAIVSAYRYGIVANEPVSFVHQNNNASIIATFGTFNGRYNFSIRNVTTGSSHQYFFNAHRAGKDSQTFIPHEVELFVNMLESVIKNSVMLSAKFIPAAQVFNKQQNNGYQQPTTQQPQMTAPQQMVQQTMAQQPASQIAPQQQMTAPQTGGLPQSLNDQNVEMFNF